jgi:hypothetical protein
MITRAAAAILLAVTATACASGGQQQSPSTLTPTSGGGTYTTQVAGYLARLQNNASQQGYSRVAAGPVYGNLADDATASHNMEVVGGNAYVLFGACDNDCTDVDLKIFDNNGNLLMQDVAVDDTPVLMFTANGSGRYRVQVVMATCSRNPCYYGIQLMAR